MKEFSEVVLLPSGELVCRRVQEMNTTFPQSVLDQFIKAATINLGRLAYPQDLKLEDEDITAMVGSILAQASMTSITVVCQLHGLKFTSRFETANGLVTPVFGSPQASQGITTGAVRFNWSATDAGIPLWFGTQMGRRPNGTFTNQKCYLFALDSSGHAYRLPIPNIYEDCSICMGEYYPDTYSVCSLLSCQLNQFYMSNWNTDLMMAKQAELKAMFRFKPNTEGEGFYQLGVEGRWQDLCGPRISHSLITEFVSVINAQGGAI